MLSIGNRSIRFLDQYSLAVMILSDVTDICFDYGLDIADKQLRNDIDRLQQYCALSRLASLLSSPNCYLIITSPVKSLDTLKQIPITTLKRTLKFLAKALPHRFINARCNNCTYDTLDLLPGELKDLVLVATSRPPDNLSKIKNFVQRNALLEISQRFEQNFSLAKTLNFL